MRKGLILLLLLTGCAQPPGGPVAGPVSGPTGQPLGGKPGLPPDTAPSAAAGAAMAPGEAAQVVASLPAQILGARRSGPVTDFEARGGVGLGASQGYADSNGNRFTVYLYDRGRAQQPEGHAGPAAQRELRAAIGEINMAVQAGLYRSSTYTSSSIPRNPAAIGTECARFETILGDGSPAGDAVCVTVFQGRFLKVRMTMRNPPHASAAGAAGLLVTEEVRRTLSARNTTQAGLDTSPRLAALP